MNDWWPTRIACRMMKCSVSKNQDHLKKEKHIDEDIDHTRDVTEQILWRERTLPTQKFWTRTLSSSRLQIRGTLYPDIVVIHDVDIPSDASLTSDSILCTEELVEKDLLQFLRQKLWIRMYWNARSQILSHFSKESDRVLLASAISTYSYERDDREETHLQFFVSPLTFEVVFDGRSTTVEFCVYTLRINKFSIIRHDLYVDV